MLNRLWQSKVMKWGLLVAGLGYGAVAMSATVHVDSTQVCASYSNIVIDASGNVSVTCGETPPAGSGAIGFSAATATVNEGVSANVTIVRTGGTATPATVSISTSGSTAVVGTDYSAITSPVTFAAGETSKTISIQTLRDTGSTANKTLRLTLSTSSAGWVVSGNTVLTLTINNIDSDAPSGDCPTSAASILPLGNFGLPGSSFEFSASSNGSAYSFTPTTAKYPNGFMLATEAHGGVGGYLNKDFAVSTCPGDFTSSKVVCSRKNASGATMNFKYATQFGYCKMTLGQVYYLNIQPAIGVSGAVSGIVTTYAY